MNKHISDKISELRKARGITQEKLGELLGVTSQAVSRWEKGDSMPDIMLIPKLCEIFGISSDYLLEVPANVQKQNYLNAISAYAKKAGKVSSVFESFETCVNATDEKMLHGSSYQGSDGTCVFSKKGFGLVVKGKEMTKSIFNVDHCHVSKLCTLLSDKESYKIICTLGSCYSASEKDICEKANVTEEKAKFVLFELLKRGYVEIITDTPDEEKYVLGGLSYPLIAIMGGAYLSSPEGKKEINSVTKNYIE